MEGGAEVTYRDGGDAYRLMLIFISQEPFPAESQAERSAAIPPDTSAAFPSQLYVYKDGTNEPVHEEFMEKVESCTLDTIPEEGGQKMEFTQPVAGDIFPNAALFSNVLYESTSGTNEVRWTLKMKNGDTIQLSQTIKVSALDAVSYYPEDVPMNTSEELQNLLDKIDQEVDTKKTVYIYLPPVTYKEKVYVRSGHLYNIYGQQDETNQTTFEDSLVVQGKSRGFSELMGLRFAGNGGIGLEACSPVGLAACSFQGWDTGAIAKTGGWIRATNTTFEDNKVGMEFSTGFSHSVSLTFENDVFKGNETGVLITEVGRQEPLIFDATRFTENEKDIENPANHPIQTEKAIFE